MCEEDLASKMLILERIEGFLDSGDAKVKKIYVSQNKGHGNIGLIFSYDIDSYHGA